MPLCDRTTITGIPPTIYPPDWIKGGGGDEEVLNGGQVEFLNNRYTTSDAVEQYWLDQRTGYCSEEEWERFGWLSPKELQARDLARRKKEIEELEAEVEQLRKGA